MEARFQQIIAIKNFSNKTGSAHHPSCQEVSERSSDGPGIYPCLRHAVIHRPLAGCYVFITQGLWVTQ
jgi:hypothetical protein